MLFDLKRVGLPPAALSRDVCVNSHFHSIAFSVFGDLNARARRFVYTQHQYTNIIIPF